MGLDLIDTQGMHRADAASRWVQEPQLTDARCRRFRSAPLGVLLVAAAWAPAAVAQAEEAPGPAAEEPLAEADGVPPVVAEAEEAPGPAAEEPLAEAGRRFDQGVAYYNEGRYGAALAEFLRAYEISGEWAVLYNLGQVSAALGRAADAYVYFQRYLADGGDQVDEPRRAEVRDTMAALEPRIARIAVEVDVAGAEVLVDGHLYGTSPLAEPVIVEPGSHVVEVRGELIAGGRERREIILASGLTETVRVVSATPPPPSPPSPAGGGTEEGESVWSSWWLWTIVGAVVVGGAVTAAVLLWPDEGPIYTEGSLGTWTLGVTW